MTSKIKFVRSSLTKANYPSTFLNKTKKTSLNRNNEPETYILNTKETPIQCITAEQDFNYFLAKGTRSEVQIDNCQIGFPFSELLTATSKFRHSGDVTYTISPGLITRDPSTLYSNFIATDYQIVSNNILFTPVSGNGVGAGGLSISSQGTSSPLLVQFGLCGSSGNTPYQINGINSNLLATIPAGGVLIPFITFPTTPPGNGFNLGLQVISINGVSITTSSCNPFPILYNTTPTLSIVQLCPPILTWGAEGIIVSHEVFRIERTNSVLLERLEFGMGFQASDYFSYPAYDSFGNPMVGYPTGSSVPVQLLVMEAGQTSTQIVSIQIERQSYRAGWADQGLASLPLTPVRLVIPPGYGYTQIEQYQEFLSLSVSIQSQFYLEN